MDDYTNAPQYSELAPEDQAKLKSIVNPEDLKEVRFLDSWRDDHELCFAAQINGIAVSFWWIDWTYAAAFCFPTSPEAKPAILGVMQEPIREGRN